MLLSVVEGKCLSIGYNLFKSSVDQSGSVNSYCRANQEGQRRNTLFTIAKQNTNVELPKSIDHLCINHILSLLAGRTVADQLQNFYMLFWNPEKGGLVI